jgi:fibronectin-binding autotransporter adhesin
VTVASTIASDFSGFKVHVIGYSLDVRSTLTPPRAFESAADDPTLGPNQFRILLQQGKGLDTDATPRWFIDANTSLRDAVTPTYFVGLANPVAGEVPTDGAPPRIGYALAVAGRNEVFVRFSEPVTGPGGAPITAGDFGYTAGAVTGLTRVTASGATTTEALLTLNTTVKADDMINGTTPARILVTTAVQDAAPVPNAVPAGTARSHRVSDVALGLPGSSVIEPVWAKDQTIQNIAGSGIGLIQVFDGSAWLRRQMLTIEGHIDASITDSPSANLWWDVVPAGAPADGFWLPPFATTSFNGLVTGSSTTAVGPFAGTKATTQLRDFPVDGTDARVTNGSVVQFVLQVVDGAQSLYAARLLDPNAADWYRHLAPWEITMHDLIEQRAEVSILKNVINPGLGEVATLHYVLPKAGNVSIIVFDLAGNVVRVLARTNEAAGDYAAAWDGKNQGGRTVARGVYFVKIVAPGIDETRKVLIVR